MTEKLTARIGALLDMTVAGVRVVGGQHGFRQLRGTLADGRAVFVKASLGGEGGDAFAAEANGLRWLAAAGAVPVPEAGF
jgi:fructosamine-3-kinase